MDDFSTTRQLLANNNIFSPHIKGHKYKIYGNFLDIYVKLYLVRERNCKRGLGLLNLFFS